ncbi:hypothetical protein ACTFIU_009453 [Dictyostelium citrinum]
MEDIPKAIGCKAAEQRKLGMILQVIGAVTKPLVELAGPVVMAASDAGVSYGANKILQKIGNGVIASKNEDSKEKKNERPKKEINEIKDALKKLDESVSNVVNEISNEYKARAAKSEDKEVEYMKLKFECPDLQKKSNTDLAQNVVQLKNLTVEKNYLEVSIKSLEITIKTMAQCDALSDISNIQDLAEIYKLGDWFQIDFLNQIKQSGLNWLSLAQINFVASNTITGVKKNFDDIMSNLPNKSEAEAIVKVCCDEIEKTLDNENKKIDEIKKESDQLSNKTK